MAIKALQRLKQLAALKTIAAKTSKEYDACLKELSKQLKGFQGLTVHSGYEEAGEEYFVIVAGPKQGGFGGKAYPKLEALKKTVISTAKKFNFSLKYNPDDSDSRYSFWFQRTD